MSKVSNDAISGKQGTGVFVNIIVNIGKMSNMSTAEEAPKSRRPQGNTLACHPAVTAMMTTMGVRGPSNLC